MAFDGIMCAALTYELQCLVGGRISKIAQPESDELLLTIKTTTENRRLLISASASLPFFAFTEDNKPSPLSAPSFCMTLRKHISGGRIKSISQLGLERIIEIYVEHLNEMGDPCKKRLIIEMMGKYSNIIFVNEDDTIIDSIKHIGGNVSSLREVLPGRRYYFPESLKKEDPLLMSAGDVSIMLCQSEFIPAKALVNAYSGISMFFATALVEHCGINGDIPSKELSNEEREHLSHWFVIKMDDIKNHLFDCRIFYQGEEPKDFSVLYMGEYEYSTRQYLSVSSMVFEFYNERSIYLRMSNKSAELRKTVRNLIERCAKKIDIQEKQLKSTEKKEDYKLYGELLSAYAYSLPVDVPKVKVENYYTGEELTINVDPELSIIDNAKKYYQKYNKAKRMEEASLKQLEISKEEYEHLLSIEMSLNLSRDENDLKIIHREMQEAGYLKKATVKKGEKLPKAGKPYHYVTEDGFHIYVGRNNYQNEELTFHFAAGTDMWFHAKNVPGSHVIVKTDGRELPDHVYEVAGAVAAFYSSASSNDKVEIDYIQKKNVKKAPGQKPGFVIYHTNYSLVCSPGLSEVTRIND